MNLNIDDIVDITSGVVRVGCVDDYFTFDRFSENQQAVLTGNFQKESMSSSSVLLEFKTDASEISFDWLSERTFTVADLQSDFCVDGLLTESFAVLPGDIPQKEGNFSFALPKGNHVIQIYLCDRCRVSLKNIALKDASYFEKINHEHSMICFGDSITQGFGTKHPCMTYVNRLSVLLDTKTVNKGIGGICFCPQLIEECAKEEKAEIITLAFGTNDWCTFSREELLANIENINNTLKKYYSNSKVYVITPLWREDMNGNPFCCNGPAPCGDFFSMIADIKKAFGEYNVIDGFELVPNNSEFFSDGRLHPSDFGSVLYADMLYKKISAF